MDKKTFFDELTQKLKSKGVGDSDIQRQLNQFDSFFSTLNEEDLQREMNGLSDVDAVAAQICDVIGHSGANTADDLLPAETLNEDDDDEEDFAFFDAANSFPEDIETGNKAESANVTSGDEEDFRKLRAAKRPGARNTSAEKTEAANRDDVRTYPEQKSEKNSATIFMDPVNLTTPKRKRPVPGKPIEDKKKESSSAVTRQKTLSDPIRFSELDNVVPLDQKNVIIFWVVFVLTLPITIALLLGVIGIFAAVFLLMAGIIAGCLISLVGIAAGGTAYSLLGIIYGILKFGSARAESLYEIGNAILVGGICLLAGVLLYNLAIRLIPFLLKYLGVFFRFVTNKIVKLFKFIKRECTGR